MMLFARTIPYALTYAVLTGSDGVWNWVLGILFGSLVALASGGWRIDAAAGSFARLVWLPWLVCGAVSRIARGSWQMLCVLVGRRPWRHVGFVTSSAVAQTDAGLALLALVHSASPGSVAADICRETKTLVLNVIDARDPERTQTRITRFYDRYQRRSVR